jgi:hypothetical protein
VLTLVQAVDRLDRHAELGGDAADFAQAQDV